MGASRVTTHRILAIAAATAGLLAAFASSPASRREEPVAAMQLAEWIRARKPGLRIIDVRSSEEFEAYHVPGSKQRSRESLASMAVRPNDTVVLISDDGANVPHVSDGNVYVLRGGIRAWTADVLNPTLPHNASPEAAAAFKKASEMSRYFGGAPHGRGGC
jgi:rhodanese-related sulfurtransferase